MAPTIQAIKGALSYLRDQRNFIVEDYSYVDAVKDMEVEGFLKIESIVPIREDNIPEIFWRYEVSICLT